MYILDEDGNQNRMNTIEIETYRAEKSPMSGCLERKSSVKETIQSRNQLGKLNYHLKNLGGDVKNVRTRYTAEGKKVTFIKIKSRRNVKNQNTTKNEIDKNATGTNLMDTNESLKDILASVRASVDNRLKFNESFGNKENTSPKPMKIEDYTREELMKAFYPKSRTTKAAG